ncbi:MAG TPA: glycosyltransferase [Vicinamibacterales bacterium]|nr:glycosyltransferase [Vicinamibacterales bacterium]
MTAPQNVTVSIGTRHRAAALDRCIRSLALAADRIARVIVVDDASEPPVDVQLMDRRSAALGIPIDVLRLPVHTGVSAARNLVVRRAATPYVLNLDDDAFLVERDAIARAAALLDADDSIAAIAFAQADEHATPLPASQQPAPREGACYVPSFVGFAFLARRDRLLEAGGFREEFIIHGEERELCLRWLDRGWRVVYLPDAPVAHVADRANRDPRSYVRHVIRNDCLNALYNEPAPRAIVSIPIRLLNFRRMAAGIPGGDPHGLAWIVRELWARWPGIRRERRPVRWGTLGEWRRLRDSTPPYAGPAATLPGVRGAQS